MSREGAIIHCGYCGEAGHNKGGCVDYKLGLIPKKKDARKKIRAEPEVSDSDGEQVPLVTQERHMQTMAFVQRDTQTYEPEVLSALLDERASSQREEVNFTPLPESSFIQEHVMTQMHVKPSTGTKEGNVQRKRQVLALAKLKAAAERRDIADQAKFDAAMEKLQQEEQQRAESAERKKQEAAARKLAAEEKRKAEREAKQLAAEEKKLAAAEKKKKAHEEKLVVAEQKKLAQEARKKEAAAAKHALAEQKRLSQEARKREVNEAQRREEEEARTRLNHAITEKMQREEEERQKAFETTKRKSPEGSSSTFSRAPYKTPRRVSMFDYPFLIKKISETQDSPEYFLLGSLKLLVLLTFVMFWLL